jgi:hypothetical protein
VLTVASAKSQISPSLAAITRVPRTVARNRGARGTCRRFPPLPLPFLKSLVEMHRCVMFRHPLCIAGRENRSAAPRSSPRPTGPWSRSIPLRETTTAPRREAKPPRSNTERHALRRCTTPPRSGTAARQRSVARQCCFASLTVAGRTGSGAVPSVGRVGGSHGAGRTSGPRTLRLEQWLWRPTVEQCRRRRRRPCAAHPRCPARNARKGRGPRGGDRCALMSTWLP